MKHKNVHSGFMVHQQLQIQGRRKEALKEFATKGPPTMHLRNVLPSSLWHVSNCKLRQGQQGSLKELAQESTPPPEHFYELT